MKTDTFCILAFDTHTVVGTPITQSGILKRKDSVSLSYYKNFVHWRVKIIAKYFIFYKHIVFSIFVAVSEIFRYN